MYSEINAMHSLLPLLLLFIRSAAGNLLIPGIVSRDITIKRNQTEVYGFFQSALNGSEVEIRIDCLRNVHANLTVQYVIRSSPCANEFFVKHLANANLLEFYFNNEDKIPAGFSYPSIYYYRSNPVTVDCSTNNGADVFSTYVNEVLLQLTNVTPVRTKRKAMLNGNTIDGGASNQLTTFHPLTILPIDAMYCLIVKISYAGGDQQSSQGFPITLAAQWRGPHGFLSAIDYPLYHFYAFMSAFYIILALIWLIVCFRHYKDLLRIQFWIGAVIIVGMVEKAVFYSEYANMNETGVSIEGLIEFAELVSCFKRTMAHVLIIIVSVGYGVVKPRLGQTVNQVAACGFIYFVFCTIEGFTRVSTSSTESIQEKQVAKIPLIALEIGIAYWIFSSLVTTMRALRVRRNEVKLVLYTHFTNVLIVSVIIALIYMSWSIYIHCFQACLFHFKQLWIDTAFWHVYFCFILVSVMYLWRPANNNQRYAFTPLLDNSEDENDDDELFNSRTPMYELVKQRQTETTSVSPKPSRNDKIDEDLKWIESNIPTSLADALIDEDEEAEFRELEASKML